MECPHETKHSIDHEADSEVGVEDVEKPGLVSLVPPHVEEVDGVAAEAAEEEDGGGDDDEDMEAGQDVSVSRHLHDWTLGEQQGDNMIYYVLTFNGNSCKEMRERSLHILHIIHSKRW